VLLLPQLLELDWRQVAGTPEQGVRVDCQFGHVLLSRRQLVTRGLEPLREAPLLVEQHHLAGAFQELLCHHDPRSMSYRDI
jgi:hypothetical protein